MAYDRCSARKEGGAPNSNFRHFHVPCVRGVHSGQGMILRSVFAAAFAVILCGPADASPQADAEYLVDRLMADNPAFFQKSIRDAHVAAYSALLNERSVKVIDREGMGDLLPDAVVEEHLASMRAGMVERMTADLDSSSLAQLVEFMDMGERSYGPPPVTEEGSPVPMDEWVKGVLNVLEDKNFRNDYANAHTLVIHQIATDMRVKSEVRANTHIRASFLADMLETDGVFHFPNRIWRRDLIREVRGESR